MDGGNSEGLAPASSIAIAVEPLDDFLDAKGARGVVAVEVKFVDEADVFCLDGVDVQFLLDFGATFFGFYEIVPRGAVAPFQKPCRAFSFVERMTCSAFSRD